MRFFLAKVRANALYAPKSSGTSFLFHPYLVQGINCSTIQDSPRQ